MVNRNYKDTIFRMLFSDRKNLLSLYNAINGTSYMNPEDLEIVTLENAIYMGMKMICRLLLTPIFSCMSISQHTHRICPYGIFFTYPLNTRSW